MKKLSILIPSTYDREEMLEKLLISLYNQLEYLGSTDVEIKTNIDNGELSIGMKRNLMILNSAGQYVVFIDSDDEVSSSYIFDILEALKESPDTVGFLGYMTTNGIKREGFKISKDLQYQTINIEGINFYERYNNHLSPVKREIALKIMFADVKFAEDFDYAKRLKDSGLIHTEVFIPKELYYYKYINPK